jgi:hypothetical protein
MARAAARTKPKPASKVMPVERVPGYQYLLCDHWAASMSPAGQVELSSFIVRNKYTGQNYSDRKTGDVDQLALTDLIGSVALIETATIRMTPQAAMECAEILLRHVLKNKLIEPAEVADLLKSTGILKLLD